jgi:hypothetical protein
MVDDDEIANLKAGDDASTANFVDIKDVLNSPEKMAFDHYTVISDYLNSKKLI